MGMSQLIVGLRLRSGINIRDDLKTVRIAIVRVSTLLTVLSRVQIIAATHWL